MPDTIASDMGLNEVMRLGFANLEDKVKGSVNFLNHGLMAEEDRICTGLGSCKPHENCANHKRIQEVREEGLTSKQDRTSQQLL